MWIGRAPARGRYDRGLSPADRFGEQRRRLLAATVQAELEGTETVTRVVALAGVGRSTFYEFFDDFSHALSAAHAEAVKRMRAALASVARDERWLDELVRTWLEVVRDEPVLSLVALRVSGERSTSELGSVFAEMLGNAERDESSASGTLAELGIALAAASAEACARELAQAALRQPRVPGTDAEQVARLLGATVQGLLRRAPGDKI